MLCLFKQNGSQRKRSIKSRLHIIRIFKSEKIFYCRPFSYYFLIIILQRSPKYFPLLPDFSNPLSLSFREVQSTFLCYRTSQTPYLNCPVIPQGPKHSCLLSDFIVILSFRSVCQLCGWTVPLFGPRYLRCFSDVLRHQSEVLCVLWTVVRSSSPRYYTCRWINVSPSGPKYYPCSRMSVKLSIP
jgi:hypothetical protein